MNNWGKKSQLFYDGRSRRARARQLQHLNAARHRRALIDDEDVYGAGQQMIHTSFDGWCGEQRRRLETAFADNMRRVRAAQMARSIHGWDDEIPWGRPTVWRYDGL